MFRFRNWKIYNEARKIRLEIHNRILKRLPEKEKYNLKSQIQRAMDSIILNIAEGSYRKSDKDFAHFLNQSLTSLYEVVSGLDLLLDSGYIREDEHREICDELEKLAKQICSFNKSLKQ
jgi:four helix bundle protein